jgi:ParB-like chromosome segregation protein Spo0J
MEAKQFCNLLFESILWGNFSQTNPMGSSRAIGNLEKSMDNRYPSALPGHRKEMFWRGLDVLVLFATNVPTWRLLAFSKRTKEKKMDVLVTGVRVEQKVELGPVSWEDVEIRGSSAGPTLGQQGTGPAPDSRTEGEVHNGGDAIAPEPATGDAAGTAEEAISAVRTGVVTLPTSATAKRGDGGTAGVIGAASPSASATNDDNYGSATDEAESAVGDEGLGDEGLGDEGLGDEGLGDEGLGDEDDGPQPLPVVEPPADFDWRKLTPRVYGKSLPPLDPVDLQSLEHSIVSRGILYAILIDELSNIIDGNTRWEICVKKGITPPVKMVSGLTDEEKEEEALSSNVARRQLKDPDVERQVREARLENMFKAKKQNSKKWTLKRIARAIGVSVATVSLRWRERQNSKGEIASMLDARRKYTEAIELEAVRLVEEGMPSADVARTLMMHPKAVQRAWNKEKKRREAGKTAATQTTEPIADSDGVPELHRRSPEQLGQNTQAYIDRLKAQAAEIRKEIEEISDIDEMTDFSVYFSVGQAFTNFGLSKNLYAGGEKVAPPGDSRPDRAGNEPDPVLRGIVIADEPDEVCVALPVGGGGVIDKRNGYLAMYGQPKVDEVIRVRVEGFDWKRGLWKLQRQARQTVAPAPGAIAGSHRDDRFSPDTKLAGRKAGPKNTWVTK